MKTFDITVGKSVGDIFFGMSRDDARQLLGEYREFKNNFVKMNSFDQFAFCNLGYDENNKVEFVSFNDLNVLELKLENKTISSMTALEMFAFINNLDKTVVVETGGVGFESNTLGIAAFFEKTPAIDETIQKEIVYEKLESITIAVPEYWNKYKA